MTDMMRRKLLGGALAGTALLSASGEALARRGVTPSATTNCATAEPVLRGGSRGAIEFANIVAYRGANAVALNGPASARRVVMMGDSLTWNWRRYSGSFFADNGLVDRSIGGQTTAQMLMRFPADAVGLKPQAVHIMGGANDFVGRPDPYDAQITRNSLAAMATLAKGNGIKVIVASMPPASGFIWRNRGGDPMKEIKALNAFLQDLCAQNGYTYCDYWPVLRGAGDRLKPELGHDTVHMNTEGYLVMKPVLLAAIDAALKSG